MTKKLIATLGELLLIAAALLGLYLVYQVWFSNVRADVSAEQIAVEIEREFESPSSGSTESELVIEPAVDSASEPKRAIGLLYIPRLKADVWRTPIISDVSGRALSIGVGHYPMTSLPGQPGNFAIAGHRATNGEPFARFEKLAEGDLVFVQTKAGFFTYELFENLKIQEREVWFLDSNPKGLAEGVDSLITLTSCDPRWNSTRRWAWWGRLVDFSTERPKELQQ